MPGKRRSGFACRPPRGVFDRGEPAGDRGDRAEALEEAVVDLGPQRRQRLLAPPPLPAPRRFECGAKPCDVVPQLGDPGGLSRADTARTGTRHSASGGRISCNAAA